MAKVLDKQHQSKKVQTLIMLYVHFHINTPKKGNELSYHPHLTMD